jgi:hypothetical protein
MGLEIERSTLRRGAEPEAVMTAICSANVGSSKFTLRRVMGTLRKRSSAELPAEVEEGRSRRR